MRPAASHPWRQAQTDSPKARPRNSGMFSAINQPVLGEVDVEVLRRAFKRSGLSKNELARRLGWLKVIGNVHMVNEALGFEPNSAGRRRKRVRYATALRLAKAMGADLLELGL